MKNTFDIGYNGKKYERTFLIPENSVIIPINHSYFIVTGGIIPSG
jgi:hypothetical protein